MWNKILDEILILEKFWARDIAGRDMRMNPSNDYPVKAFKLKGLTGISDKTLEMHFKLYEGYVKATNSLTRQRADS